MYLALEIAVHGWGEHEIRSARIHDNLINSKLMKFRANKFIKNMILERILWKSNEKSSLEVKNLDKILFNVAFVRSADGAVVEGVAGVALDNPPVPSTKLSRFWELDSTF